MRRTPWWLWANVVGLDAPLIALAWQAALAAAAGYDVRPREAVILAMVVWGIYAADRVFDGMRLVVGPTAAARHRFGRDYRDLLTAVILVVGLVAAGLAMTLPAAVQAGGVGLAGVVAVYFGWNQLAGTRWGRGWLKEVIVSVTFAAGAGLVPLALAASPRVVAATVGFAGVCYANCLIIARLERERDRARGERSIAAHFNSSARPGLVVAAATGLLSLAGIALTGASPGGWGVALAAVLLLTTPWWERGAGAEAAAVWADFALFAGGVGALVADQAFP